MKDLHLFKADVEWVEYHQKNDEISFGGSLNVENIKDDEIERLKKSIEESSISFTLDKGDKDE